MLPLWGASCKWLLTKDCLKPTGNYTNFLQQWNGVMLLWWVDSQWKKAGAIPNPWLLATKTVYFDPTEILVYPFPHGPRNHSPTAQTGKLCIPSVWKGAKNKVAGQLQGKEHHAENAQEAYLRNAFCLEMLWKTPRSIMFIPSGKLTVFYWKLSFIVSFPIKNGWIFHSYVNVYQRVGKSLN